MPNAFTKLPRKVLLAIVSAVLLVIVFTVIALFPRATGVAIVNVTMTPIEKVAPADTGSIFITPASADWWKTISSLSPVSEKIHGINPLDSKVSIKRFGYTFSQNNVSDSKIAGPLRLDYIEVTNSNDTSKLVAWLNGKSDNGNSFKVFSKDNVIVIAPSWVRTETDVFAANTLDTSKKYADNIKMANRDENIGFSYIDFNAYSNALFNTKDPAKASLLKEFFKNQFSINMDTDVWTGNASSYNTLWYGDLVKGNVTKDSIDINKSKAILSGFQNVVSSSNGIDIINPNESILFSALYLNVTGASTAEDAKNFQQYFAPYDKLFTSAGLSQDKSVYRGMIDLSILNSVMSGLPVQPENIDKVVFAANGTKIAFGFVSKNP
jgi:hypothetical protein